MNFFGIGLPEMAVIAAIGLLVFGPKRLPELGRTLGRTLKGFQSASREFEQEFRNAIDTDKGATDSSAPAPAIAPADSAAAVAAFTEASAGSGAIPAPITNSDVFVAATAEPAAAEASPPSAG
jgi:sec-independent protein translocase protein TatA